MDWVVTVDGQHKYTVTAETDKEAMAMAHRLFASEHDNSRPDKGRITECVPA